MFDVKKNQRDAKEIIKGSIHEAIRKLLPLQYILNEYLVEDTPAHLKPKEEDFDKTISDANKNLLKQMIKAQDLDEPPSSNVVHQLAHLKEMLKNDPLDTENITETHTESKIVKSANIKSITNTVQTKSKQITQQNLNQEPYVLKKLSESKISVKNDDQQEPDESIAYYKSNNSKIIDSFSNNKSNIRSVFYSNEPEINKVKKIIEQSQAVNTADVENYLKEQGQTTLKMSDDPNINSIKNVNPDKFKNKYYQV